VGIFGLLLILGGLGGLIANANPVGCIVAVVLGVVFFLDGNRQFTRQYPRERFRERVAAMRDPTGLRLNRIRNELGRESEFRRTETGSELIWRVGGVSVTLGFDGDGICTGIVAARGITGGEAL
jgi:hypothetical protein